MLTQDNKLHEIMFECDICTAVEEATGVYGREDFNFFWGELREKGWRAWHTGKVWKHKCPNCVANHNRDVVRRFAE